MKTGKVLQINNHIISNKNLVLVINLQFDEQNNSSVPSAHGNTHTKT